jgi:uncharacterized membrane protein HdeD (DUF308 family)
MEATMSTQAIETKGSVGWSIALSIAMILAGLFAITVPQAAGLSVSLVVAWLLIFSAAAHFVFAWHRRGAGGVIWELLLGVVYGFIGIYILLHPVAGLVSLTLGIAFYLFAEGVLELILSIKLRPLPGSGWLLFDGVITLLVGFMIWRAWPVSSNWAIGTLVGVSMLFAGLSRLMMSLATRHEVGTPARDLRPST